MIRKDSSDSQLQLSQLLDAFLVIKGSLYSLVHIFECFFELMLFLFHLKHSSNLLLHFLNNIFSILFPLSFGKQSVTKFIQELASQSILSFHQSFHLREILHKRVQVISHQRIVLLRQFLVHVFGYALDYWQWLHYFSGRYLFFLKRLRLLWLLRLDWRLLFGRWGWLLGLRLQLHKGCRKLRLINRFL